MTILCCRGWRRDRKGRDQEEAIRMMRVIRMLINSSCDSGWLKG
jgi:hypothetical protein